MLHGCCGTLRDARMQPPVLKVTDNHQHYPTYQGYLWIPIHGGIELMVSNLLSYPFIGGYDRLP